MENAKIRVRYAPSPTGFLHIGGLRTALYNELLARQSGGDFILRIEDTDRSRFVEGGIENICNALSACGVVPNEGVWLDANGNVTERGDFGPYLQSERKERHLDYAKQLIAMDKAYYCFCTPKRLEELREEQQLTKKPTMYDGLCRALPLAESEQRVANGEDHVIRLKLPREGNVTFMDVIRDDVTFEWALIDDQVLIKTDGFPTYHLAATCDDHDMEITHVIRGEEWLSSTPKHLFIYEAFGWTPPKFSHLPLLLNADRSKLSKRQNDVAVTDYLQKGYLPEALLNFVALLGWNPTADREIYTHEELAEMFHLAKINKSGAVFNLEKLDWMNEQYLRSMPEESYLALTRPFVSELIEDQTFADRCLLLVRDRVQKPQDVAELTSFFFAKKFDFASASITWKTQSKKEALERLNTLKDLLSGVSEADFSSRETLETAIKKLIADRGWGNGDTLWPLRVSLSGAEKSPSPFELLETYGKARSLERIESATAVLS
ncbi:glutamate--tRNA ligase [Patescibacteria group bacterium]|nr:glutamate--tRNA ligase [Patescibacteria group bacterium]